MVESRIPPTSASGGLRRAGPLPGISHERELRQRVIFVCTVGTAFNYYLMNDYHLKPRFKPARTAPPVPPSAYVYPLDESTTLRSSSSRGPLFVAGLPAQRVNDSAFIVESLTGVLLLDAGRPLVRRRPVQLEAYSQSFFSISSSILYA